MSFEVKVGKNVNRKGFVVFRVVDPGSNLGPVVTNRDKSIAWGETIDEAFENSKGAFEGKDLHLIGTNIYSLGSLKKRATGNENHIIAVIEPV